MPGNEDQEMEEQYTEEQENTSVIYEYRSGWGEGGGGGGSSGGGGGGGGGSGGEGGDGSYQVGVFVDGAGNVVGPAMFNPDTGVVEDPEVQTQVIEESRTDGSSSSGGSISDSSGDVEEPIPGVVEEPTPSIGTTPEVNVRPIVFDPPAPGSRTQYTRCLPFAFGYRVMGAPAPNPVQFSLRFSASTNHSASAAGAVVRIEIIEAALFVIEQLELGLIMAAGAYNLFVRTLAANLAAKGLDTRDGWDIHIFPCVPRHG